MDGSELFISTCQALSILRRSCINSFCNQSTEEALPGVLVNEQHRCDCYHQCCVPCHLSDPGSYPFRRWDASLFMHRAPITFIRSRKKVRWSSCLLSHTSCHWAWDSLDFVGWCNIKLYSPLSSLISLRFYIFLSSSALACLCVGPPNVRSPKSSGVDCISLQHFSISCVPHDVSSSFVRPTVALANTSSINSDAQPQTCHVLR